jgi:recombination protein RecA
MRIKVKKPSKSEGSAPATYEDVRKQQLRALVADLNSAMKGVGRIDIGSDISWLDPERINSGILSLDVVSCGGLPRGGIVEFWGPYSSAKTTTLLKVIAAEQRLGHATGFAVGETFSKDWARTNGVWIPYSQDELDMWADNPEQVEAMIRYSEDGVALGYGDFVLIQHVHGDGLLEATARCVKSNTFSVIGVDSLAVLKNTRQLEDAEVGDEDRGGGGQIQMFNRFTARLMSALNTRYTDANVPDMNGEHANSTCVVCLNQARIKQNARVQAGQEAPMEPVGGQGLRHAWVLSVVFKHGSQLRDEVDIGGKSTGHVYGVEITIRGHKSKIGPEQRTGRFDLYLEDTPSFAKGEIDTGKEVLAWGLYYNVIEQSGNSYGYNGDKLAVGRDKAALALRDDPSLLAEIYDQVVRRCRR